MDPRTPSPPKSQTLAGALDAQPNDRRDAIDLLWSEYRRAPGDETRNALVEAYQPLIVHLVRRFSARLPRRVDRGDLATAANMGLIGAIEAFDDSRGVRFEFYCERRVRGALLDELRHMDWLPRPWRKRLGRQKRAMEDLRSRFGREASDEEIAEAMGLEMTEYVQIFGSALLNAPAGSMAAEGRESEGVGVLEDVSDPAAEPPTERLTREEILALVAQRLSVLEYRVVYLRYWEELSMREIGGLTDLSESRVCKIHASLIERLRVRFRSDEG